MSKRAQKRPVVDVPMAGRDLLAAVAAVAVDPTCKTCGGPARLRPGPAGAIDLHVEHRKGCEAAEDGQNRRSEA
ncbi:hypothetical protein ACWGQ5_11210 [Streptomyces sp. NPDC055722]